MFSGMSAPTPSGQVLTDEKKVDLVSAHWEASCQPARYQQQLHNIFNTLAEKNFGLNFVTKLFSLSQASSIFLHLVLFTESINVPVVMEGNLLDGCIIPPLPRKLLGLDASASSADHQRRKNITFKRLWNGLDGRGQQLAPFPVSSLFFLGLPWGTLMGK